VTLLLRGVGVPVDAWTTTVCDVLVEDGVVTAVTPVGPLDAVSAVRSVGTPAADEVLDLHGYVLLPAPAEPHAHLDKALLGDRLPNPRGDLLGAIEVMHAAGGSLTPEDLVERATRAALLMLGHGTTAIRSHADVGTHAGLRHVEALVEVREALRDVLDLQVVALVAPPTTGPDGGHHTGLARSALEAGADVLGGAPHLDPDPHAAIHAAVALAAEYGVPLDLHTDETLDAAALGLEVLAGHTLATGFAHGVTASHCVSLGVQPPDVTSRVAAAVARAGVGVVTLPQTNLFLQGRDVASSTPRGLTAVRALLDAGATVAGGGDNVRDPFNTMGRGDAFETASLLVTAGHLLPGEALTAVTTAARAVMGLPAVAVAAGSPAELVAVRAATVVEALAAASQDRVVVHRGAVVARTRVERTFPTRRSSQQDLRPRPFTSPEQAGNTGCTR
jgi:cytosine deaminase